jgi:phospholipid/cholesterol/gamma-HCH transport system substrate-binding protein
MAERKQHTEMLVGVFMLIGFVLLGGLIFQFGRIGDRFLDYYTITVVFDDASGVIQGGDVRMGGAMVGRVAKAPNLNKDLRVAVALSIRHDVRIPVGSKFTIGSASLLGDRVVIITPPNDRSSTAWIEPGAEVRGGGVTGLDSLQDSAEAVTKSAESLFNQAEDTMKKVDRALADVRGASDELEEMLSKVNKRVLSDANLSHLESSLANLDKATNSFNEVGKDLPKTMDEAREAFAAVREAADSAEETFATLSSEVEGLKPAIKGLPEAIANVSRAAHKAGNVMDKAEDGGLLGVLTDDKKASADASGFISNLRRHGILRYRDDGKTPAEQSDPRERFQGRRR